MNNRMYEIYKSESVIYKKHSQTEKINMDKLCNFVAHTNEHIAVMTEDILFVTAE